MAGQMVLSARIKRIKTSSFLLTFESSYLIFCPNKSVMCLSQTTGYAIQALACLQRLGPLPCFIRDVAECTRLPRPYLAHIFNRLAHKGIVSAKRGYRGGITLTRPAHEISLLQVVEAVEGKKWIGPCLLGLDECRPPIVCPTHDLWSDIKRQIEVTLRSTTLAEVITPATAPGKGVRNRGCSPVQPCEPRSKRPKKQASAEASN